VWVTVCRRQDIPPGRGWPVQAGSFRIAVFETAGGLRAVENTCLHIGNPIDDGPVAGEVVTCPWHGWQYDLRTGDHLTVFGRRQGLRTFPIRLNGDDVEVEVGGDGEGEGR
jgi:nitrite reductase (NADH) small subunit